MAIKFSKEQIFERLEFENLWWVANGIDQYFQGMKKREYYRRFFALIEESSIKRALVLMGPRRVGKTVMIFHAIQGLIDKGIPSKNICYFSIETPIYNDISLEELVKLFFEKNHLDKSSKSYIFFDEIQYLKDWEIHLKSLVDSYHHLKFIVSGSAAAALNRKSKESGAGRFTDFVLPPLTFHEYLNLNDKKIIYNQKEEVKNIHKLNDWFTEYINFGGYPEVSLSKTIQQDPGRYIKNDIIDKVILRDIPSLYGIQDIQELNSLFTYLAYNSGMEFSLDTISKNSGVAKNTIKKYLEYLEAAFLIIILHKVNQNSKRFLRATHFKVYLTNPSLRAALFSPIKEIDPYFGNMVETAIFSQWQHTENFYRIHYARWDKGEVDLVYIEPNNQEPLWCIEIKWSDRVCEKIDELKHAITFGNNHRMKEISVTTKSLYGQKKLENLIIEFKPSSHYCYEVGFNLLLNK